MITSREKITDSLIKESLEKNELKTKGSTLNDSELIGFQVACTGTDILSFRYYYRFNGRRKMFTIGKYPNITTYQAREIAKKRSHEIGMGIDPLAERQSKLKEQNNTLNSYLEHEYTLHLKRAISGKDYSGLIRNHFKELLPKTLADINKTDLTKWLQDAMEKYSSFQEGYSAASIRSRYSTLKSLFTHARINGAIKLNPFDNMPTLDFNRDESTQQQAKRTYLEIEQQQDFLKSVEAYDQKLRAERRNSRAHGKAYLPDLDNLEFASHHKVMFLILYYMGLRMGDVISLNWSHIIDTPFTCNITKVLNKTRRKVKAPFSLPMPPQVRDALKAWKKQTGGAKTGLVFINSKTEKSMDRRCLDRAWKWIKNDAGLHEDLQLYSLRHNFISWLVIKNTPLKVVASMSGHKTTNMIDLHYSHLTNGVTTQASDIFASLLDDENQKQVLNKVG